MSEKPKPRDQLPSWPQQTAVMRAEVCILYLRPFMSAMEYMSIRHNIALWDMKSDTQGVKP